MTWQFVLEICAWGAGAIFIYRVVRNKFEDTMADWGRGPVWRAHRLNPYSGGYPPCTCGHIVTYKPEQAGRQYDGHYANCPSRVARREYHRTQKRLVREQRRRRS